MKSILLVGALTLMTGVAFGQVKKSKVKVKVNPNKTTIKAVPSTKTKQKPGTNSVAPAQDSNRKRPGGTISSGSSNTRKVEGTEPKKKGVKK
jgi:hypothetical protein